MKKILLVIAVLASVQVAGAQELKEVKSALKKVESAKETSQNPKKADSPATWIKLGQACTDVFSIAQGSAWIGASEADLMLVMSKIQPRSVENVEIGGQPMVKKSYETADYYFNANGLLSLIEVTDPESVASLKEAVGAYAKAGQLDEKGKKTKNINEGLTKINSFYNTRAYNKYQFGKLDEASIEFENAVDAFATAPLSKIDTNAVYNAGLTAWMAGQNDRAKTFLDKSLAIGYYGVEGDIYAKLADIAEKQGDKAASLKYLEDGFVSFPKSQGILVGLINYYMSAGTGTDRLFELLDVAKQNEHNNASLWYVEGDIRLKLDPPQVKEAFAAYDKCSEINPDYEYGHIGKGIFLYNQALKLQDAAGIAADDAEWRRLTDEFEKTLKSCIEPFEKAFEVTKDENVKVGVCEYLKNACFRFREDPEYMAKYEKYNAVVAASR